MTANDETQPRIRFTPMRRELHTMDPIAVTVQKERGLPTEPEAYMKHLKANDDEMRRRELLGEE